MPGVMIYKQDGLYRFAYVPKDDLYAEILKRFPEHGYDFVAARAGLSDCGIVGSERTLLVRLLEALDRQEKTGKRVEVDAELDRIFPHSVHLSLGGTPLYPAKPL